MCPIKTAEAIGGITEWFTGSYSRLEKRNHLMLLKLRVYCHKDGQEQQNKQKDVVTVSILYSCFQSLLKYKNYKINCKRIIR